MELKTGYKQTEVGVIPSDWEVKSISTISRVVRGGSPRPAGSPKYFNGDYIPWLTVASLTNIPNSQIYVERTEGYLTEAGSQFSRTLNKGTLIIANSGATLGIAKILNIQCCANDGIAALLEIDQKVEKIFLVYFINSLTAKLRETIATGNGQPNLNTELIGNIQIPLPPTLAEQTAIATAFSDMDQYITHLEKLIAKKRDIKQGAMQELLKPKEGWVVRKLGEMAEIDSDNLNTDTSKNYTFQYISLEDVDNGVLKNMNELIFASAPSRARRRVKKGDILISTVRPNLKSHLFIKGDVSNWVCSTGFSVLRCNEKSAFNAFVYHHLFASFINNQIDALISGSNYPSINSKDVKSLEISFPLVAEQTRIATILSDMDAEIAALETKLTKAKSIKQGMMQQLLTGKIRLI